MITLIKMVVILVIFSVGALLVAVMNYSGVGALPKVIIFLIMFAAMGAVWKYSPKKSETKI